MGIPFRIIISERNLKDGNVEWKRRDTGESGALPIDNAVDTIKTWYDESITQIENSANSF